MKHKLIYAAVAAGLLAATGAQAQDKVPLKTEYPPAILVGTPVPFKVPNLEPKAEKAPAFMVPAGTTNIALGKKVTSSYKDPIMGTFDLVTDGDKAADEGSWVELGPGKQWLQIDLEKTSTISAVIVWHFHAQERVYLDVVAQASDDPEFKLGVTTIYNADAANDFGFGAGKDPAYIETRYGKLMDGKSAKGRYVRLYSNGNTTNKQNHYIEVEVFGKPAS